MGTNDERREVVERLRVFHEVAQLSPLDQDAHYQKHTNLLPPEVAELMFYGERKKLIGALIHHKILNKVWSLNQFYSVDFSQSRIDVNKCVFYKRTIKVCVSCC